MFNSEMNSTHKHVFVPVSDELIFDSPELIEGPLVPYSSGMACHGWLSVELNPTDDTRVKSVQQRKGYGLLQKVGLRSTGQSKLKTARHLKLVFGG